MTDTVRTQGELLALFADNTSGAISAQDARDFIVSAMRGAVLRADAHVTDAQLRDLVANPIEVVAAPGSGYFIDVLGCVAVIDTAAGAYVIPDQLVGLRTTGDNGALTLSLDAAEVGVAGFAGSFVQLPNSVENVSLKLNINIDMTGGNSANTLSLRVYYRIEPAMPFGA